VSQATNWLSWASIALYVFFALRISLFDLRNHLVRNADIVIGLGALFLVFLVRAAVSGNWNAVLTSVIAGLAYGVIFIVLARVSRGQLGSGDVGVAALLGVFLGGWSVPAGVIGWAVPFALSALPAIVLWAKKGRATEFAFAPFILLSAPVTLLIAEVM
jgi:leader peptidase (prepilin peptidase) / N-methyltransferase